MAVEKRRGHSSFINGFGDVTVRVGNANSAGLSSVPTSNSLCGTIGYNSDLAVTLSCSQHLCGRYVSLQKPGSRFEFGEVYTSTTVDAPHVERGDKKNVKNVTMCEIIVENMLCFIKARVLSISKDRGKSAPFQISLIPKSITREGHRIFSQNKASLKVSIYAQLKNNLDFLLPREADTSLALLSH